MNNSLAYQDFSEPEPSLADHSDLKRWDKWLAWDRRKTNFEYARNHGYVRMPPGQLIYDPILKSQKTRLYHTTWKGRGVANGKVILVRIHPRIRNPKRQWRQWGPRYETVPDTAVARQPRPCSSAVGFVYAKRAN
jgi:hypothetical protein